MDNFILLGAYKDDEVIFEIDNFFEDVKKNDIGSLSLDMNQMLDSVNYFFNNTNPKKCIANDANPKQIGCIFNITDAYGILMCNYLKDQNKIKTMLITIVYFKVKNKILTAIIYCPFNRFDSIKFVANISEKWMNEILDAN